jgi:tetratricopeptide (TPR) repeat protein
MKDEVRAKIEPEFNRALKLRDQGDWLGAAEVFEQLNKENPNQSVILKMWASVYFHLEDWHKALPLYERAASLSPKSELSSLGLFHSLWNLGKQEEAFAEIRRFLSISDSKEYRQLIKEMAVEDDLTSE